jgi:hypothetical protein
MSKLFMPSTFVQYNPDHLEMNIASIIWGVSLAFAGYSAAKATRQTWSVWKRTKGINSYVVLIWTEWLANLLISILSWLYLWETVPSS